MKETKLCIDGNSISYVLEEKDIYEIGFYPNNPRIATIVDNLEEKTDDNIDAALWQLDQTHKLARTIQQDGGLIHPIIVYNNSVLEGNTRLCCYRHLYTEIEKDEKWRKILCQVITQPLKQDSIYRLLCSEHIIGKADWDAYEKAHFFSKIRAEGRTLEEIKQITKVSVPTIIAYMDAYDLMVKNNVQEKEKYSYFDQIVRSKEIKEILEIDPQIIEKLVVKVKNGTIGRAESIRDVGTVWKHKEYRKAALSPDGDFEQVVNEVKVIAPMTDSPFMKQTEELLKKIEKLERIERDAISQSNTDKSKIKSLTKEMIKLCNELGIKLHVPQKIAD